MAKLLMLAPAPIETVNVGRGVGGANLLTPDPLEAWWDTATGSVNINIDFGAAIPINTVFLGSVIGAVEGTSWQIRGGVASYTETLIQASTALRAPDAAGQFAEVSHAFWTGATHTIRLLRLTLSQPEGGENLSAGVMLAGLALVASMGHEWGAGRKVIDTGTSTPLPSGSFAIVEGARKGAFSWTFGDLTRAETDDLYALQLDRGETRPLLVVEDPDQSIGLRWRLHYGKLTGLRQFERRNPAQTRWELSIEEWGGQSGVVRHGQGAAPAPTPSVSISAAQSQAEGNSGTKSWTYTVTRSATAGAAVVPWSFSAGGTSAADFQGGILPAGGTVNLADGVASGTITITTVGDATIEVDETFTVTIAAPSGYALGSPSSATGTILNDDVAPPPTVSISAAQSQSEGNSGTKLWTYTVTRSATAGAAVVPWSFSAGGTSAADFQGGTLPIGGAVNLADGVASGTFTITTVGDASVEADEAFTVTIAAPSGYALGSPTSATGTILNDDVAPVPLPGGTSATRYSFAGVGYRAPSQNRSVGATNLYHVSQFLYASPGYPTNNIRFFMPNFYGTTANEIANTNAITIEAIGIDVGGAVHTQTTGGDLVNSDGTTSRLTFPATIPAGAAGILLDPIEVTCVADTTCKVRCAYSAPVSGNVMAQTKSVPIGHGSQGGAATQSALVSAANYNANLSNTNTHSDLYAPLFAVAQGGDGREAVIVAGDSIGFGQNDSSVTSGFSTRGAFGFLERGLDDNATAQRIAGANISVAGQGPQSWGGAAYWNLKRRAVQAVNALCGDWPFDRIISEHGTNSITVSPFDTMMQTYWTTLKAELGDKPLTQTGLLPLATTTDSFATLVNQSASASNAIGGNRWNFNDALAAGNYVDWVDDYFEPWRKVSYDTTTNRDKLRITGIGDLTFATTLAAAFAGGSTTGTMSLSAAPTVGMGIMWNGSGVAGLVTSVSGAGPYNVGITSISGNLPALASGTVAREILHDAGGLHPSPYSHTNRLAASVVEWKQSKGWT